MADNDPWESQDDTSTTVQSNQGGWGDPQEEVKQPSGWESTDYSQPRGGGERMRRTSDFRRPPREGRGEPRRGRGPDRGRQEGGGQWGGGGGDSWGDGPKSSDQWGSSGPPKQASSGSPWGDEGGKQSDSWGNPPPKQGGGDPWGDAPAQQGGGGDPWGDAPANKPAPSNAGWGGPPSNRGPPQQSSNQGWGEPSQSPQNRRPGRGPPRGRSDQGGGWGGEQRQSNQGGWGGDQRQSNQGGWGGDQRPSRGGGWGDGPPRGGNRRDEGWGDGPPRGGNRRDEGWGDGPPRGGNRRDEGWGDGPPRGGNRRDEGWGDGPPRGGNRRDEGWGDGPPRSSNRGPRGPPRGRSEQGGWGGDQRPSHSGGGGGGWGGDQRPSNSGGGGGWGDDQRPPHSGGGGGGWGGDQRPSRGGGGGGGWGGDQRQSNSGGGGWGDAPPQSSPRNRRDDAWGGEPSNSGGGGWGGGGDSGNSWENKQYSDRRGGRPRGGSDNVRRSGDRGGRGGSERRGDSERGRRPDGRGDRRGGRRGGGQGRAQEMMGEVAKVKRHRFIMNKHELDVQYREEDTQLDPEAAAQSEHLRASKEWEELPLPRPVLEQLTVNRYFYPSKIQALAIEYALKEPYDNLLAQAPNGSGKTATFVLASLARVDPSNPEMQVIAISHTVELSHQTHSEYNKFADCLGITVNLLTKAGEAGGQVVVTTEGVLTKSIKAKKLSMENLKMFVIDEADHLLNEQANPQSYGNFKHIFLRELPQSVQYMLVSATFPKEVREDIGKIINEFYEISIKTEELMVDTISHYYIQCPQDKKIDVFNEIIRSREEGICIGFINTCDFAQTVYGITQKRGHRSALLMGKNMKIEERNCTMKDFKEGRYSLLLTTNLLARGIDNTMVKTVVNFDLPRQMRSKDIDFDLYLHRSGRCSRFGRHGVTINMVTHEDELEQLIQITNYYGFNITPLENIEDLIEYEKKKYEDEEEKAGGGGGEEF